MSTAIIVPLFDRYPDLPYCGMAVLHAMSLRQFHPEVPLIVCDYSQSSDVDEIFSHWASVLRFDVNKLSVRKDLDEFSLEDARSIRYDAILRLAETCPYEKVICVEADMLVAGPVLWLAEGNYHIKFVDRSYSVSEGAAVSNSLLVLNMGSVKALRLIALARSLHQDRYVWRHLSGLTVSRASGYSERLMEVAVRLLDQDGIGPITWSEYNSCYVHYARFNKENHSPILELAQSVLARSEHMERFVVDFGELESLIFRETSGTNSHVS